MTYSESARDKKVRRKLEAWPVQQFGQPSDRSAFDGATACTHVCIQKLAWIWQGRKLSIDYISGKAGYYREVNTRGQPRGFTTAEAARAIDALNLPYTHRSDLTWEELWDRIDRGPVLYAVRYGSEPDWRGYVYNGVRADGDPGGFAWKAGRTQLTGFENGAHMVMAGLKRTLYTSAGKVVRLELVRMDPNHGSGARPERPPYHLISSSQGKREYLDYREKLGRSLSAFIPTRELPV